MHSCRNRKGGRVFVRKGEMKRGEGERRGRERVRDREAGKGRGSNAASDQISQPIKDGYC
jgi:hypothetical protein